MTVIPFTPKPKAPTVYSFPEYAYYDLVQLRDHMQWMAKLTAASPAMSVKEMRLGMAWWLRQAEKQLDEILKACEPKPGP